MAANERLESFLSAETAGSAPTAPPEPPAPSPAPTPPPDPTPPPTPRQEPPAKAPEPDEDHGLPVEGNDTRMVPLASLQQVRNDWKSRFAAEQARAQLLAQQLEEARRPPEPPPQPQYMPPPPDPAVDPIGALRYVQMENQRAILNERLNNSEAHLRDKLGDEKVNAYVAEFQQAAQADPSLWGKLYSQASPYSWMSREMDRQRTLRDVGDDPAAYRARIAAEERAKWEAERAAAPPPVSPAAGLPPSLATARSVAGRTSPAWQGETSLDDVVRGIPSHVRAQRIRSPG